MSETCEDCRYFNQSKCHRFPRQMFPVRGGDWAPYPAEWLYPTVHGSSDWCGEFAAIRTPSTGEEQ